MKIDLNADLGESPELWASGTDRALLEVVTSANVCCGAYAGDRDLIVATCRAAREHGVAIGAQVGYPDRANFGRVFVDLPFDALQVEIYSQIDTLHRLAAEVGAEVSYVKPHGALYHAIATHEDQAAAVVDAVANAGGLPLVGPPGSGALTLAHAHGLPVVLEGFADRGYRDDGTLIPRGEPGALLEDPDRVGEQVRLLAELGVQTVCVHSDTPRAVEVARAARSSLEGAGHAVRSFAAG